MAFDACMMRAVLHEFERDFTDAKIEKVLQPQNDEIDLVLHKGRISKRLVFNVGPNAPRLQLSDTAKENPLKAPMLCMLLRKYFTGARIISVTQPSFDRIADFTVSCYDEMGYKVEKHIICEIMGKYANLIVLDGDGKILTAMKIIDFAASTIRQVIPGMRYQIPAMQDKLSPLLVDKATFFEKLSAFPGEKTSEKFITSTYSGIATQIAREITYRAVGTTDVPLCEIEPEALFRAFSDFSDTLNTHSYKPTVVFDKSGKPIDYSFMDITYLGKGEKRHYGSLGELFDVYFAEKDRLERVHRSAHDVITLLSNARARTERKLAAQREALVDAENAEEYKRKGDLITSNIYLIKRGMTSFSCTDYFDPECPTVEVELDNRISPSQNAQRMYKQYNKRKTAKRILTEQIKLWEGELQYLESVSAFLEKAETEAEIALIRDELYSSGYSARMRNYKPKKQVKNEPTVLKTSGGYTLYVGKNNLQNEKVSFKLSRPEDIWFHAKGHPGSHVLMVTGGEEPSEVDYTEAASVAAYYSKATGDLVAVDYTKVKNLKRVKGEKPGFVIYHTNYTAFVRPLSAKALTERTEAKENG